MHLNTYWPEAAFQICARLRTLSERGATLVTSNLPFDEWTEVFGSQRLTGALLDRLTHHAHVLTCNGDSYRLAEAKRRRAKQDKPAPKTTNEI